MDVLKGVVITNAVPVCKQIGDTQQQLAPGSTVEHSFPFQKAPFCVVCYHYQVFTPVMEDGRVASPCLADEETEAIEGKQCWGSLPWE